MKTQAAPPAGAQPQPPPATVHGQRPSTPLVRRRAAELGLDLADVVAHGPRITLDDLGAAAAAREGPQWSVPAGRRGSDEIRAVTELDVTAALAEAGDQPDRFVAMVAAAVARSLTRHLTQHLAGTGWALRLPPADGRAPVRLDAGHDLSVDGIVRLMRVGTPASGPETWIVSLIDARGTGLSQVEVSTGEPDVVTVCLGSPHRRLLPVADRLGGEVIAVRTLVSMSVVSAGGFAGVDAVGAFCADVGRYLARDGARPR